MATRVKKCLVMAQMMNVEHKVFKRVQVPFALTESNTFHMF